MHEIELSITFKTLKDIMKFEPISASVDCAGRQTVQADMGQYFAQKH